MILIKPYNCADNKGVFKNEDSHTEKATLDNDRITRVTFLRFIGLNKR